MDQYEQDNTEPEAQATQLSQAEMAVLIGRLQRQNAKLRREVTAYADAAMQAFAESRALDEQYQEEVKRAAEDYRAMCERAERLSERVRQLEDTPPE